MRCQGRTFSAEGTQTMFSLSGFERDLGARPETYWQCA